MRLVRACDLVRTPWKNGGGTTAEIAVEPQRADLDGFDWRVSMADVAGDGPFSRFPGIDRTLTLVEGAGMDLVIDGQQRRLDRSHPMQVFAGEATTTASLVDGPIRDFNVMTRRSRLRHVVSLVEPGRHEQVAVLFALEGPTAGEADGHSVVLARFDTMLFGARPGSVEIDRRALMVRMQFD